MMPESVHTVIQDAVGASSIEKTEVLQSLWSGYGEIQRVHLVGGEAGTVIVKRVSWPTFHKHPKGWATSMSHERKVRSYGVEASYYANQAKRQRGGCRVPHLLAHAVLSDGVILVLEDLNQAGFAARRSLATVSAEDRVACLSWLADLHATHLAVAPQRPDVVGLWAAGTYWHLATRPDEWEAIDDPDLKRAASTFDRQLRSCRFQTLLHGDAKLANFCFSSSASSPHEVAAVDFQYAGGGCGIQDVVYFLSSCLDERGCELHADELLNRYLTALRRKLRERGHASIADDVVAEWRGLEVVAWADFVRFLAGWSPGHWKMHGYSRSRTERALAAIEVEQRTSSPRPREP